MSRPTDLMLTALAPAVWGSTYYVTTELLPQEHPLILAVLRALPAGLLLLVVTGRLPPRAWIGRILLLGGVNFAVFWSLLFVAAYRLPGGVAATLGAVQALAVIGLARLLLGTPVRVLPVAAAVGGIGGVALLILGPEAALDPVGVAAGLGGAVSMAAGTVLSRKWQPPVSPLTFAAWQLTAGGVLLLPLALLLGPPLPAPDGRTLAGLAYLGLVGAALSYALWFRGIGRIEPARVSTLGFLSPLTAVVLGWAALGEGLTPLQGLGAAIVLGSVWASQRAGRDRAGAQGSTEPAAPRPRALPVPAAVSAPRVRGRDL